MLGKLLSREIRIAVQRPISAVGGIELNRDSLLQRSLLQAFLISHFWPNCDCMDFWFR